MLCYLFCKLLMMAELFGIFVFMLSLVNSGSKRDHMLKWTFVYRLVDRNFPLPMQKLKNFFQYIMYAKRRKEQIIFAILCGCMWRGRWGESQKTFLIARTTTNFVALTKINRIKGMCCRRVFVYYMPQHTQANYTLLGMRVALISLTKGKQH